MSAEFPEVRPPEGRTYPGDGLTAVAVGCGGFLDFDTGRNRCGNTFLRRKT